MKEISLNALLNQPKHDFNKIPPLIKVNRNYSSFQDTNSSMATPPLIKLTDSSVIQESTIFPVLEDEPILITENSTERQLEEKPQTFEISIEEEHEEQEIEEEETISMPVDASWMKDKNSFQILTDILTKNLKMVHYLKHLQELMINNKHNANMRRSFDLLCCVLVKLHSCYQGQNKPVFSTYQSETHIDLNPPFHSEEKESQIRRLKQAIEEKKEVVIQIRNQYDRIIQNYAQTIYNINAKKQPPETTKSRRQERLTFSNERLQFFQQSKVEINQGQ